MRCSLDEARGSKMTRETRSARAGRSETLLAGVLRRVLSRVLSRVPKKRGVVCGGFAAAATSYANVRASFSPNHHSKQSSRAF